MPLRILIVDDVHPKLMQLLAPRQISFRYEPAWSKTDVLANIHAFDGLVLRSKFRIDHSFLKAWPNLRVIARAGAGLDNVDLTAAAKAGIAVFHAAEGNADAVAEHTLAMMLMLLHRFPLADSSVRSGEWEREAFRSMELKGKTVGLLGYGNMGRAVAKRLQSFDCRVIAYDKYRPDFPDQLAESVSLSVLQQETDVLSLHVPLTEETTGMVDAEFLQSFLKLQFLVNTSRGPVLSIGALVAALESRAIRGAALDVLPHEPPLKSAKELSEKYRAFFMRPDVIFSPHVAGWSLESYERISEVLANKIIAFDAQSEN